MGGLAMPDIPVTTSDAGIVITRHTDLPGCDTDEQQDLNGKESPETVISICEKSGLGKGAWFEITVPKGMYR